MKKNLDWNLWFSVVLFSIFPFLDNNIVAVGHTRKTNVHLVEEDDHVALPVVLNPSHSLEDFFWTGSGDGPGPPMAASGVLKPSVSITTTTLLATVFLDSPSSKDDQDSSSEDEDTSCLSDCPLGPADGQISPTRPGAPPAADLPPPDQRYWLLTVLQAPVLPPALRQGLARLYSKAFSRQQERHLGLVPTPSSIVRKKHQTNEHKLKHNKNDVSSNPGHFQNSTGAVSHRVEKKLENDLSANDGKTQTDNVTPNNDKTHGFEENSFKNAKDDFESSTEASDDYAKLNDDDSKDNDEILEVIGAINQKRNERSVEGESGEFGTIFETENSRDRIINLFVENRFTKLDEEKDANDFDGERYKELADDEGNDSRTKVFLQNLMQGVSTMFDENDDSKLVDEDALGKETSNDERYKRSTDDDDNDYISQSYLESENFLGSGARRKRLIRSADDLKSEIDYLMMKSNYSIEVDDNSTDVMKREVKGGQQNVEVFLQNITKEDKSGGGELRVVYWVSVGGRPVPARTAARDMRLLADEEVVAELGYPFTTKAEPYLQSRDPPLSVPRLADSHNTWMLVLGGVLAGLLLLLLLLGLLGCRLHASRGKGNASSPGRSSQDQLFRETKGFSKDDKMLSHPRPSVEEERYMSPGYTLRPHHQLQRTHSPDSTDSLSSGSDLSQMTATLRQRQKVFEQQMQSDYATVNKNNKYKHRKVRSKRVGISDVLTTYSDVEAPRCDGVLQQFMVSSPGSSSEDSVIVRRPRGVTSPTSYLSMPSVRSFPRGNAVEPLSRVLEPLSVRHLDLDSPVEASAQQASPQHQAAGLQRTGSDRRDPGVLGPVVWDLHSQRVHNKEVRIAHMLDSPGGNMSRMRQRFSGLVEEALSMFNSSSDSNRQDTSRTKVTQERGVRNVGFRPDEEPAPEPSRSTVAARDLLGVLTAAACSRRHSAKDGDQTSPPVIEVSRPHTAVPPRPPLPQMALQAQAQLSATQAWGSSNMSGRGSAELVRQAAVDASLAHSQGSSLAEEPALPLLRAIRKELDKLPGTSDA